MEVLVLLDDAEPIGRKNRIDRLRLASIARLSECRDDPSAGFSPQHACREFRSQEVAIVIAFQAVNEIEHTHGSGARDRQHLRDTRRELETIGGAVVHFPLPREFSQSAHALAACGSLHGCGDERENDEKDQKSQGRNHVSLIALAVQDSLRDSAQGLKSVAPARALLLAESSEDSA